MTKFLLAAVTSVSLLGIFSYLAHVFLTSSSFTLHKMLHPSWSPRWRSFTYILRSVVATKFLLAIITSVSLRGIFSYLAHVFLTSSSFTLHKMLLLSWSPRSRSFTYILRSVVMTKFLLSAVTSFSLRGIFSYLAHVFLTSSSFTLHKMRHPSWSPRSRSFTFIFDSVVATKFLLTAITSVSLHGICSYLAHVFLSSSCTRCSTPPNPKVKVVH